MATKTTETQHLPIKYPFPRLPWLIGGVALLLYVATLERGLCEKNLALVTTVADWGKVPLLQQTLLWLVTAPLKLLPQGWLPVLLNLESAVFGALTLVVLTRCVQLLPFNRLRVQWQFLRGLSEVGRFDRQDAWVPAVLAAVACGLEPSFWREAVCNSGMMLDMLVLAVNVWCLMEFRATDDMKWLRRLAVCWGVGMAEDWLLILAWPLMFGSVIWLLKFRALSLQLWGGMLVRWGAGFSLILLMPVVNWLSPHYHWTLLHSCKETALGLWQPLNYVQTMISGARPELSLLVGLCALVPLLPMIFRLNREASYHLSSQARVELLVFQVVYFGFMCLELWLCMEPLLCPQYQLLRGGLRPTPLLSQVWLNALGVAYLYGHFLLICGVPFKVLKKRNPQFRLPPFLPEWLRRGATPVLYVLPVVLLGGLVYRNLPTTLRLNQSPLTAYARETVARLPAGGGVLVSDVPERLLLVRSELAHRADYRQWTLVDADRLVEPEYRQDLEAWRPLGWPGTGAERTNQLSNPGIVQMLARIGQTNRIIYLHPSCGGFFEWFDGEAHGLHVELVRNGGIFSPAPVTPPALVRENETYWDGLWSNRVVQLTQIPAAEMPKDKRTRQLFFEFAPPDTAAARLASEWYSVSLTDWAVRLQRAGDWPAAERRWSQLVTLNSNNVLAKMALEFCHDWQAGRPENRTNSAIWGQLTTHPVTFTRLIKNVGLLDVPAADYYTGTLFQKVGLHHQALVQMQRAVALTPGEAMPLMTLAEFYIQDRNGAKALELIRNARSEPEFKNNAENAVRLDWLQASAEMAATNPVESERTIQAELASHPGDLRSVYAALAVYAQAGEWTNAMKLVASELRRTTNSLPLLQQQALLQERVGQYTNAILTLNQILTLTNSPTLEVDRAGDRLLAGDAAGAEADFKRLAGVAGQEWRIQFGMAQVELRRTNTLAAIQWLQQAVSNAPPRSNKKSLMQRQLMELQSRAKP